MKKILIVICLVLIPLSLFCQQSKFVYVEGQVSIKRSSGELLDAEIDHSLNIGDSIITGEDGFAELSLENSSSITIDSDTVFLYSKKEKNAEKKSVFMVVLGKIGFKFDKLLNEPDIETPSTVAGIRGTQFTVLSALDGSSLYIVDEGSVAVEAEGALVVLNMEEGVEVPIGETPGEVFEVKIGKVDFSGWLDEGNKKFESDPAGTLKGITDKLVYFSEEANGYYLTYENAADNIIDLRSGLEKIEQEKGTEAKDEYFKNKIVPMQNEATNNALNYRYYGLSALSLRRYVLSSMYIEMKTKYIMDKKNKIYLDFISEYEKFLDIMENSIIKYLVEADI